MTGAQTATPPSWRTSGALAIVATIATIGILGTVGLWQDLQLPLTIVGATWVIISLVVWAVYGAVLLVLLRRPERTAQLVLLGVVLALIWGGLASTDIAGRANTAIATIARNTAGDSTWTNVFIAPTVEQTLQTLGIVLLALLPAAARFGPSAGFVCGMLVGVSFQVVENFVYTLQNMTDAPDQPEVVLLETLFMRGLVGFFSHIVYAGVVGAAIGWLLVGQPGERGRRLAVTAAIWLLMVGLHSWSNWASHESESVMYVITMVVGLIALVITYRRVMPRKQRPPTPTDA